MTDPVKEFGRKADDSALLGATVRIGLVSYGAVHVLIAWLAASLALGGNEGAASKDGALSRVAQQPFGSILLYVMVAGFAALVLWQLVDAVAGHRDKDGTERKIKQGASVIKIGIYGLLGYTTWKVASSGSSGDKTESLVAKVMGLPAGQVMVGLIGLSIAAYGCSLIYNGVGENFKEHLTTQGHTGDPGRLFVLIGKIGYVGKGVSFIAVSGLIIWAAWTHDPDKSGGLDAAMRKLLEQPFGSLMLAGIAFGIGCYGLFCFARARHLDR